MVPGCLRSSLCCNSASPTPSSSSTSCLTTSWPETTTTPTPIPPTTATRCCSVQGLEISPYFSYSEEFPDKHYYVAMCLTYLSMFLSIGVYFIGIFFFLDVKNITDKFRKKTKNKDEDKICQLWTFLKTELLKILVPSVQKNPIRSNQEQVNK